MAAAKRRLSIPLACAASLWLAASSLARASTHEEPVDAAAPDAADSSEPDPPEPVPAESPPPPPGQPDAPTPEPAASAATEPAADAPSPLLPPGETLRMAERPLGSGTFKPGKGIQWGTADKRFVVNLGLALQFLYTFNDARPRVPNAQNTSQIFEVRRARVFLQGNVFSEHVKYYLQLQLSPRDLGIQDGKVTQSPVFLGFTTFDRFSNFVPQIGVQWIPYSHQRVAPIMKLQMIDFSMASAEFGLERDIGVQFLSNDLGKLDRLKYHLGVFMGEGVQFTKPTDVGMIYVGRLEYLPFGDFDDYPEVDFNRRMKPKLAIAAAYAFDHGDRRSKPSTAIAFADGGTTDSHNATADVVFKMAGFSMLGDFWFRHGKRKGGGVEDPITGDDVPIERARNGIGGTAQAGFLIPRLPIEIAGRYSGVRPIGKQSSLLALNEAGPGLAYYFAEHSVKLQLDYFHGWGAHDVRTERVRLQLQVTF